MIAALNMENICSVILAAGKGTRMKSNLSKVLHNVLGYPLVWYPLQLARSFGDETVAVVGHGREQVQPYLESFGVKTAVQDPPKGTGHAVLMAKDALEKLTSDHVLILAGDMPLIQRSSLEGLVQAYTSANATMGVLSAKLDNPFGYGRIIRGKDGLVQAIVEENDADADQKRVNEVNTAVYIVKKDFLLDAVGKLKPDNAKGELYLTDIVKMADTVVSFTALEPNEANGINSREQLAAAAAIMQARINRAHMDEGVTLIDPRATWIGPQVKIGADVEIWPGTHILGECEIATGVKIQPCCLIESSKIGANSTIGHGCVLENADIAANSILPAGTGTSR